MPDISMLIKPASSLCNLRCRYCFYHDEAASRAVSSYGMMDAPTLDIIVRRAVTESSGHISFSFQGGEPTVRGIEYFELLHEKCDYYKRSLGRSDITFSFSIQTNGILTASDERWAKLFAKYHYLVGLSVDGTKDIHDENRVDADGRGTYSRVEAAARMLGRHGVDFNILTV
ncbi:MAG: radical SAM protein, partial [Eubacteriales bacterium]